MSRRPSAIAIIVLSSGVSTAGAVEGPLQVGMSVGYTALATMDPLESTERGHSVLAPAVALHFQIPVSRWLGAGVQPSVLRKGVGWDYWRDGRKDVHLTVLELETLLRIRSSSGGGPFGEVGVTVGVPLAQRGDSALLDRLPEPGTSLGLVLGAGWQWRVAPRKVVFLGFQHLRDLSRTFEPAENLYPHREGARSRVLLLNAGFAYVKDR